MAEGKHLTENNNISETAYSAERKPISLVRPEDMGSKPVSLEKKFSLNSRPKEETY